MYYLKDFEKSQKVSSGDNFISRPHSRQKLAFRPGTFDTAAQFFAKVKRIAGLPPHYSFRELKSSGRYKILFRKYEALIFPSEKIRSTIGFKGTLDGKGIHVTCKTNPMASRLVSLAVQKIVTQKLKFCNGDFVRIVKKGKAFRKNYKHSFTDEVYDTNGIPTFSPPACSLEDADNKTIKEKRTIKKI